MPKLFEETEINGMRLKNRFVRSATWEGMAADDGACTAQLIELTEQLSAGGVGLIIASYAYVLPEGKARIGQLGIYKDELIDGLREMTRVAHRHGAQIAAQIVHAGIYSDPQLTGQTAWAPSHVPDLLEAPHEEMSTEYIQAINHAFGEAAARAKEAGFDAVQIHCAHSYLHSQFLSRAFNRRSDAYGGPMENRARAVLEVLEAMRARVGPDFPVLIKMNCQDFLAGGLTLADSVQVGVILEKAGIDTIELSGGTFLSGDRGPVRPGITSRDREAYFRQEAKVFKERLRVPLMLVGGIRSFSVAEQMLDEGYADYISLCRPLVRDPDLIQRWADGDVGESTCLSENLCRDAAFSGKGIHCVVEKRMQEKGG